MSTGMIIFLVVLVVLIGICVGLYFFGKKAEKKQAEQKEQMDAVAQTVSMLVIDKKRLKLKVLKTYQSPDRQSQDRTKDHDTDVRGKSI